MSKRCGDIPGGGFIVLDGQSWQEFLDSPMNDPAPIRVLILELANGIWDLPKGRQDSGESHLACAIRELEEETGLTWQDIDVLSFRAKHMELVMYACVVNRDTSIVLPINPSLGQAEHWDWWWSRLESAKRNLPKYLQRFIDDFSDYAFESKHKIRR